MYRSWLVGETPTPASGSKSLDHYDFGDPLFLHQSDNGAVSIISFKLTYTENFKIWQSSMTMALKRKK